MAKVEKFTEEVCRAIDHYVYRLVDPRTGATFYVGRGQDSRVFSHAAGIEKPRQDEKPQSMKLKTIWAIKGAGLDVQHVIHRHGLTLDQAREVEAALIHAYPGISNEIEGYHPHRGVQHAQEIVSRYQARQTEFWHEVLVVKINHSTEEQSIYDAARYAWKISKSRAERCAYVLAARKGIVVGVFKAQRWLAATQENFPGFPPADERRFGFKGEEAPDDDKRLYMFTRLPRTFLTQAVVRYAGPPHDALAA